MRGLIAYALVVGLCVAIALAPLLQRRAWLFPMPGTRGECVLAGRYEALQVEAALGNLAGSDGAALAFAQQVQARKAVAECLAATTTLWLPLYGLGVAVLVGAAAWLRDRARARGRAGHGARRPLSSGCGPGRPVRPMLHGTRSLTGPSPKLNGPRLGVCRGQGKMVGTSPPSTLSAAPVVADAWSEAT